MCLSSVMYTIRRTRYYDVILDSPPKKALPPSANLLLWSELATPVGFGSKASMDTVLIGLLKEAWGSYFVGMISLLYLPDDCHGNQDFSYLRIAKLLQP